jgi:hypothetical protein
LLGERRAASLVAVVIPKGKAASFPFPIPSLLRMEGMGMGKATRAAAGKAYFKGAEIARKGL